MRRQIIAITCFLGLAACAADTSGSSSSDSATGPIVQSVDLPLLLPLPDATSAAIKAEDLAVRIETLSDDAFEGRGPASEKGEKAADWIAAEMARVGLSPGGENGTWFQTVGMVEQTLDEAASSLSFSGGSSGAVMDMVLGEDAVLWSKRQSTSEMRFDESELIFVGYGVVAPEYGWDDYAGLDATGKTVVMLVNDPGYAREDALFNGKAMTYYGRWTYKFEEAARQGATGAIVIHETAPASYGWDVVANSWTGSQADLVRKDAGASRTLFEAWITEEQARALFNEAGLGFDDLKHKAKQEGFRHVDLGGVTASGSIVQSVTQTESRNVLGILPGQTAPEEHILFTAHWDHLGRKTGEKAGGPTQDFYRDEVFNGAVDNAGGIAAMLEMAEALAAEELERSALFLAVTLEESGLLGSAFYAENPTVEMNQIVAGVNMDAMLPIGPTRDMIVIGYGASELEDLLKAELAKDDRVVVPDQNPQAGSYYRSDQVSFTRKGVPMLYAKNGIDRLDGGVAAGRAFAQTYTAQRYHKPMDEFETDWDLSGMEQDVIAMFNVARQIAQSDDWPTWYTGNEFEAIRQASLAAKD
ncbi:MAG: M28 family metallopeptidase [Henriciella sp.]|nr:M28 family metallopeptidase [Henriciella sp.]